MMKRLLITLILFSLLVVPTGAVLAAPLDTTIPEGEVVNNDVAVFGEDLIIESGATVDGDVLVFGGDAEIKGVVTGDLAVFGGDVTVASTIEGDIVLFGGDLDATDEAAVRGDCVLLGGDFERRGKSGLGCTSAGRVDIPNQFWSGDFGRVERVGRSFAGNVAGAIGSAILAGFLALIAASAVPQHMTQVSRTIRSHTAASGGVGLLTAVAVPAIIALLVPISVLLLFVCVGILGFPIMLALGVGLIAGSVFGWATVGQVVGQRLAEVFNWNKLSLPITAALGSAAMTLGIGLLGALSLGFFEGLLTIAVTSIGLGAVALTQFGRKPYPYLPPTPERVVEAESGLEDDINIMVDDDKITAVLDTLPNDDDMTLN